MFAVVHVRPLIVQVSARMNCILLQSDLSGVRTEASFSSRRAAAFVRNEMLTNWGYLADIAPDSDLIVGAPAGDKPTGVCLHLQRLTQ